MIEFACTILVVVTVLALLSTRHHGVKWWLTDAGKRVAFGLFLAPLVALIIGSLGGCTRVDVFAGIEATKNLSPMCEPGGVNDNLTSNLGIEGCHTISADSRTELCAVYRHHSCAISQDEQSYDGVGLTVKRRIWGDK